MVLNNKTWFTCAEKLLKSDEKSEGNFVTLAMHYLVWQSKEASVAAQTKVVSTEHEGRN